MLKVYTKVGDQGKTKQVTGKMVAKYDPQIQTLGALDELQSWLGVTVANLSPACQGLEEKLIKLERGKCMNCRLTWWSSGTIRLPWLK